MGHTPGRVVGPELGTGRTALMRIRLGSTWAASATARRKRSPKAASVGAEATRSCAETLGA